MLGIFNRGVRMTDDAKSEFSNYDRSQMKIADAAVIESFAGRVAAQFVIRFFKPTHNVKVFGNELEATKWLKSFRK